MPRILFCAQAAYRDGGIEAWLDALVLALQRDGWDVHVALAQGKFHRPDWYVEKHPLPNVIALDGTRGLREGRLLRLLEVFEATSPDVIFSVNIADALYAAAEWKRRGATARLVTCIHGQEPGPIRDAERCAAFLDRIFSVSRRTANTLEQTALAGRVQHIPTGVREPLQPPRVRTELRNLAYVGRLDAQKRALDLVPLARLLDGSGITIHVAGDGPDREAIARAGVVLHGAVTPERLYEDIYPNADALLIFSEKEGGPIVAWEAMIHGVVPVVSDFQGRADEGVLRDGETALVFPVGDVDACAAALRRLPPLLETLSRNAMKLLPRDYHLAAFEENWSRALRDVLSREPLRSNERVMRAVSPGWIERLGLSERATFRLRTLLGTRADPSDAGDEWPHTYSNTPR
ncbi:MAG TPA: glycosyltransferase family 4 protein [Thermoanaerobaculia bacterium]|nr:glycosyltransferase family 4 protein [Thermoanaerobaculia bacterium]